MTTSLLCLGFGYVAARFADALGADRIIGTRRAASGETVRTPRQHRVSILVFDGETMTEALRDAAMDATHVLISVPPSAQGCPAAHAFAPVLETARGLHWVGYLSATSVYGDRQGGWCFESDPVTPTAPRGEARARAEAQWRGANLASHVFRLPGIYGPGRSVFDRLSAGTARRIAKPGAIFNRSHVDDIAEALRLSALRPTPGEVFNIADDAPSPPDDPILHAAALTAQPAPRRVSIDDPSVSVMARSFYSEPKRVANARLKAMLGWRPRYPTYREGLAAILEEMGRC